MVEKEKVDKRSLNEWEIAVHECIDKRIQQLRAKYINKRKKKHVFKNVTFRLFRRPPQ